MHSSPGEKEKLGTYQRAPGLQNAQGWGQKRPVGLGELELAKVELAYQKITCGAGEHHNSLCGSSLLLNLGH